MNFHVGERILLTLWVGGMWTVGYIVAPTLFQMLDDRMLAGKLAGQLFTVISYIGLLCGGVLLAGQLYQAREKGLRHWRVWLLLLMLLIVVVGEFYLQPLMAELKAKGLQADAAVAREFGKLHGVASVLFLINSLAGLALVAFGLHRRQTG